MKVFNLDADFSRNQLSIVRWKCRIYESADCVWFNNCKSDIRKIQQCILQAIQHGN